MTENADNSSYVNLSLPVPLDDDLRELFVRPAWHAQAACAGMGAELFFPEKQGWGSVLTGREAKAICESCPVRAPCAEAGRHERFGIWGGQLAGRHNEGRKSRAKRV
jgi:WhiB family redox-sensing transcriptional regulator